MGAQAFQLLHLLRVVAEEEGALCVPVLWRRDLLQHQHRTAGRHGLAGHAVLESMFLYAFKQLLRLAYAWSCSVHWRYQRLSAPQPGARLFMGLLVP